MGTSNFMRYKASKVFAVLMNYCDEETGETVTPESWEVEDFFSDIKTKLSNDVSADNRAGSDIPDRNFYGHGLVKFMEEFEYYGIDLDVHINCVCASGYYEGANLDYIIEYHFRTYETDDIDNAMEYFKELAFEKPLAVYNAPKLQKKIQAWVDDITSQVEQIYADYSTPMVVAAKFSNGETVYSLAK